MPALKIVKDGNRITYILVREKENIPLLAVEDGKLIVEKTSTEDYEVAFALIAALKHAVERMRQKTEAVYRQCPIERLYWQFVREHDFISAVEALRRDE